MRIGLVGYQGCGKTTLFTWLTGVEPDPRAREGQRAMAMLDDPLLEQLQQIYQARKVTRASLELVDTPGLNRSHEGNAARLAALREVDCLAVVVPVFAGADPQQDLQSFQEDLLLTDLEILTRRIQRLEESVKRPKPSREQELEELAALRPLQQQLERGEPLRPEEMTPLQQRVTRPFRLFAEKPRLVVFNVGEDEASAQAQQDLQSLVAPSVVVPLGFELETASLAEEQRQELAQEFDIQPADRNRVLQAMLEASGQIVFYTCGPKEVRAWLLPRGGTALDAAAGIHTDLARGFIRAEVFRVEDLLRLGSERELKAQGLLRHEHKNYVVQPGDVLLIRHN